MDYLSIKQLSEKWGFQKKNSNSVFNRANPRAKKVGYSWIIRLMQEKLGDAALSRGKYLKNKMF
ncbi:MAG: hypothetical protein ACLU9T_10130 [Blautia faecis]